MTQKTLQPPPSVWPRLWAGVKLRCPNCNKGALFRAYLKPVDRCPQCGEAFGHIRADDAPPYITLLLSGHLIIPLALAHIQAVHPPLWVLFSIWIPVLMATILLMLPCAKGGTLALMWHLNLQGDEQQGDHVRPDPVHPNTRRFKTGPKPVPKPAPAPGTKRESNRESNRESGRK